MTVYQRGNSFECATFLVSLLLGKGYNAYVVSGYARKEQVQCDMTKRLCPYLPKEEVPAQPPSSKGIPKYQLKPPPDFRSQFLLEIEAKKRRAEEIELLKQENEQQRLIEVHIIIFKLLLLNFDLVP